MPTARSTQEIDTPPEFRHRPAGLSLIHILGLLGRSGSSARRSWGQWHALEHLREQGFVGTAKEALGGGGTVGATDVVIVYGGERRELAVAQAMAAMVMPVSYTHLDVYKRQPQPLA